MEIERKFLIDSFPTQYEVAQKCVFYAGYLSLEPQVRIREKIKDGVHTYKMCIKSKGTLTRQEIESDISKEFYEQLKQFIGKPFIKKDFVSYVLPDGHILECSNVDDGAFMYAEIEFESEKQALEYVVPAFLSNEATYDSKRSMCEYWRQTRQ